MTTNDGGNDASKSVHTDAGSSTSPTLADAADGALATDTTDAVDASKSDRADAGSSSSPTLADATNGTLATDAADASVPDANGTDGNVGDVANDVGQTEATAPKTFDQEKLENYLKAPVLQNLGVKFGTMDANDTGDFYGAELSQPNFLGTFNVISFWDASGASSSLSMDMYVKTGTQLVSPIDGVVTSVQYQPQTLDWEVHLRTEASSWWIVSFDHIVPPSGQAAFAFGVGDPVRAGQVLGLVVQRSWVGIVDTTPANMRGFIELQVNFEKWLSPQDPDYAKQFQAVACPLSLVRPDLRSGYALAIGKLMQRWEVAKSNASIYDESLGTQNPGCRDGIALIGCVGSELAGGCKPHTLPAP